MKRLFGTDGIRAVAGKAPLDPATVRTFGAALGRVVSSDASRLARVVLGRDTRESGPWLRDAVAAGLASEGATAVDTGVITTPGLAHAVWSGGFDAGVMISAIHNPFEDNGLKAFGAEGVKLYRYAAPAPGVEIRRHDLGLVAEEIGQGADRRHRGCGAPGGAEIRSGRRQGCGARQRVVGPEIGGQGRMSVTA